MKLELYQIDAFTNQVFGGNPACVVPLQNWLPDALLLKIAQENAVAETAFFIHKNDKIQLRWFTPEIEMDLCGHATLATAHCLKTILGHDKDEMVFDTLSGDVTVRVKDDFYYLDFPSRNPVEGTLPEAISKSLNIQPRQVLKSRDYVLVYETEDEIKNIQINRHFFDTINLDPGGVIVTAKGENCDFVSRYFTPQSTLLEDPVTGSAHCSLIPFWANRLKKNDLFALQVSERTGTLYCTNKEDRVLIGGQAVTYAAGSLFLDEDYRYPQQP